MLYELVGGLEALIEKWENAPYTGDLTKAAKANCAKELREVLGHNPCPKRWVQDKASNDAYIQESYYDGDELPF